MKYLVKEAIYALVTVCVVLLVCDLIFAAAALYYHIPVADFIPF